MKLPYRDFNYIKWGFESRLKLLACIISFRQNYIKWGFESRLKYTEDTTPQKCNYIKWGFESRLKLIFEPIDFNLIISNGDLRVG